MYNNFNNLMMHRLTTDYAKNYCNLALIVKVIVENVVTCFWDTMYIVQTLVYIKLYFVSYKVDVFLYE